ncbi:MAG: flavodoxin family protein [Campylobacteraceae bacterium]|jgi:FMN-dependent NADH-azoreductase|nr:flavodoxin family protein [Campylobacteraceae bacterium]
MKITIINSSPKGKNGKTGLFLDYFMRGMQSASDVSINYIFLSEIINKTCNGCFACWYQNIGSCIIKDDFNAIYQKIINSNYVLYASPLYALMFNGAMKSFLDRLSMITHEPYKEYDKATKKTYKTINLKLPPAIIFMVGNMVGQSPFKISSYYFKEFFLLLKVDIIAEIYRPESEFFQLPINLKLQEEILNSYTQGGSELVTNGFISKNIIAKMTEDIVEPNVFINGHNIFWKICQKFKIHPKNFDFEKYSFMKLN